MLGLLLLALVLWIALGLDRSRRYRLHDRGRDVAVRHRRRAVAHRRRPEMTIPHQRSHQNALAGVGRHTRHWLASNGRDELVGAGHLGYRTVA